MLRKASHSVSQSPTTRVRSGNPSNQTQGVKSSAPPPPSKATEPWTCKPDSSMNPQRGASHMCDQVLEKYDEKLCDNLKAEIGNLLVVAGLLLAVVTAFVIDSYKLLQEDKQDELSKLLVEVVRLLNDTSSQGHAKLPTRSTPDHHDVVVNLLWFLSMILSLIAVLIGTFCLQWISAFLGELDWTRESESDSWTYQNEISKWILSLQMRHQRRSGMIGWGVLHAPAALLFLVQLSIALFTSGLVYFLWNVNHTAAIPTLVVTGVAGVLLCLANSMPFLQPLIGVFSPKFLSLQCPYKSPASLIIRSAYYSMLVLPLRRWIRDRHDSITARFCTWLRYCPAPWRDYLWRQYDESYVELQDKWEVCSLFRSYTSGVASAFGILGFEPDGVETITSLVNLSWGSGSRYKLFRESMDFRDTTLNDTEIEALRRGSIPISEPNSYDVVDQRHGVKLVDDFFIALVLQDVVSRNPNLRHILFPHIMKLRIRIKNSSLLVTGPNTGFGHSLNYNLVIDLADLLQVDFDAADKVPYFQYISYVHRYLSRGLFISEGDLYAAAEIIRYVSGIDDVTGHGKRGEQSSEVGGATDAKEDTNPDVASPVSDAHGVDSTDGHKGKGNASHSSSGPIRSNILTDKDDKNNHESFMAEFRRICSKVKRELLELPKERFNDDYMYNVLRDILCPRPPQPRSRGDHSVVGP